MHFDDKELKELIESIRFVYGYDFADYSEASFKRRITQFMNKGSMKTLDQLAKVILKDEKMLEEFIQQVSVTVTEMFRDPLFYKSLLLQGLVENHRIVF